MADRDGDRSERARAAVNAVRHLKGRPSPEVRAALRSELDARGVADVRDRELDFLVDAVQRSPRRAAYRLAFATARNLLSGLNDARKLITQNAQPKWVAAPDGIADVQTFRDDQHGVTTTLGADTLRPARDVIARLLTDLPAPDDPDDADEPRPRHLLALARPQYPSRPLRHRAHRYARHRGPHRPNRRSRP